MIGKILTQLFGSKNERELRKLQPFVEAINSLEPKMNAMSAISPGRMIINWVQPNMYPAHMKRAISPTIKKGMIYKFNFPAIASFDRLDIPTNKTAIEQTRSYMEKTPFSVYVPFFHYVGFHPAINMHLAAVCDKHISIPHKILRNS